MRKIKSVHRHTFDRSLNLVMADVQDLVDHYRNYPEKPYAEELAKRLGSLWEGYAELCLIAGVYRDGKPLPDDYDGSDDKGGFGIPASKMAENYDF